MNLIFKEYIVKFEDSGHYYTVHVCKGLLGNMAVVAKSNEPNAKLAESIPILDITASSFKDLIEYWLLMTRRKIRKLNRYLVRKRHSQQISTVKANKRRIEHLESALQNHNLKKQIENILLDDFSVAENPYDSDS